MRLFRHGNSLALVVPDSICRKLGLIENSELDFFEIENGLIALASRGYLRDKVKTTVSTAFQTALPPVMVFSTESEARAASRKLEAQIKKGDLIAVSSDKKYYLLSLDFYNRAFEKIAPFLAAEKTLVELSTESGLASRELSPLLQAMKERGEVIEKRKGTFLLVK